MRDSDRKSLELIYEDMEGRPMAQYGSNSAAQPSHVLGTEPMVQSEVEVPEDAGDQRESDDEEMDGLTDLGKLLTDIKDTINSYEDKKQLRFNKELEEGFISGALGGFTSGIKNQQGQGEQIASAAGSLATKATQAVKQGAKNLYNKITNKQDLIIGDINKASGKPIEPKQNSYVKAIIDGQINNNVTGKIIKVNKEDKTYQVQLLGLIASKGGVISRTAAFAISGMNKTPYENMKGKELNSKYTFATRDENLYAKSRNKATQVRDLELGVNRESIVILDKDVLQAFIKVKNPRADGYSDIVNTQIFQYNSAVANKKEASQQNTLRQKGVKPTAIKWVMFSLGGEESGANLTGITDKPSIGEIFNYNGNNYIATNNGWTYPKKTDPKQPGAYVKATNPTLADEIQNAWFVSRP